MIGLRAATDSDKLHMAKCFSLDSWHQKEHIESWLNSHLTTFYDEQGPILHMAFTDEGATIRLHAQFDPLAKRRTARAIPQVLEMIKRVARENGYTSLALWSESPSLIAFMERLGFKKSGEDYSLALEAHDADVRPQRPANC